MRVICPNDGAVHYADETHVGRKLRCSDCGQPVLIGPADVFLERAEAARPAPPCTFSNRTGYSHTKLVLACVFILIGVGYGLVEFALNHHSEGVRPRAQVLLSPSPTRDQLVANMPNPASSDSNVSARTLRSGTRIRPDLYSDGHGVLSIDNTLGVDAEVKVLSNSGQRRVRDVYVAAGSTVDCPYLEEGSYIVRFATGKDWDSASNAFTEERAYFEFGESLDFQEVRKGNELEYSTQTVTLYTLPDGNIKRETINRGIFEEN